MNREQRRRAVRGHKRGSSRGRVTGKTPRATVTLIDPEGNVVGKKTLSAEKVALPDPAEVERQERQRRLRSAVARGLWVPGCS